MKGNMYVGYRYVTPISIEITEADIITGYSIQECPECEGTGWWDYYPEEIKGHACVGCKGTGKIFVSC